MGVAWLPVRDGCRRDSRVHMGANKTVQVSAQGARPVSIDLSGLDDVSAAIVEAIVSEGELRERERIIALLEPIASHCTLCSYDTRNVIALIKGENE